MITFTLDNASFTHNLFSPLQQQHNARSHQRQNALKYCQLGETRKSSNLKPSSVIRLITNDLCPSFNKIIFENKTKYFRLRLKDEAERESLKHETDLRPTKHEIRNLCEVILKSSSRYPEDILKTSWRHPKDILKSSWSLPEVILKNLRPKDEDCVL